MSDYFFVCLCVSVCFWLLRWSWCESGFLKTSSGKHADWHCCKHCVVQVCCCLFRKRLKGCAKSLYLGKTKKVQKVQPLQFCHINVKTVKILIMSYNCIILDHLFGGTGGQGSDMGWGVKRKNNVGRVTYKHTHKCNQRRSHVQYTVPYDKIQYTSLWNKICLEGFEGSYGSLGGHSGAPTLNRPPLYIAHWSVLLFNV